MTPEQQVARLRALVSAARNVLSLQIGLAAGCARIFKLMNRLGPEFRGGFVKDFPIFDELAAATRTLPIGSERLQWKSAALLELDTQLARIESRHRAKVMAACVKLIELYG